MSTNALIYVTDEVMLGPYEQNVASMGAPAGLWLPGRSILPARRNRAQGMHHGDHPLIVTGSPTISAYSALVNGTNYFDTGVSETASVTILWVGQFIAAAGVYSSQTVCNFRSSSTPKGFAVSPNSAGTQLNISFSASGGNINHNLAGFTSPGSYKCIIATVNQGTNTYRVSDMTIGTTTGDLAFVGTHQLATATFLLGDAPGGASGSSNLAMAAIWPVAASSSQFTDIYNFAKTMVGRPGSVIVI